MNLKVRNKSFYKICTKFSELSLNLHRSRIETMDASSNFIVTGGRCGMLTISKIKKEQIFIEHQLKMDSAITCVKIHNLYVIVGLANGATHILNSVIQF